jgi:competence protein ComEC
LGPGEGEETHDRGKAGLAAACADRSGMRLLVYLEDDSAVYGSSGDIALLEGDLVEIEGVLAPVDGPKWFGGPNQRSIYLSQRIVGIVSSARILASASARPTGLALWTRLKRAICSIRIRIAKMVLSHLPLAEAGLVNSAFLGMKGALPDSVDEGVRRCGISHLLSVSGMHVGMISVGLVFFLRALTREHRKALVCTIPLLCLYAVLAGMRVAIVRAVLMFGLAAISQTGSLGWSSRRIAEAVAFVVLLADPLQLAQVSFQLSFAATYGIIVLSSFASHAPRPDLGQGFAARIRRSVKDTATVYLGAQIGVAPFSVLHFRSISLVGGPATAVSAPILTAGAMFSLAGAGLHAVGLVAPAAVCVNIGRWLLTALVFGAVRLGRLPFASLDLSCVWSRALGCIAVSACGAVLSAYRSSLTRKGRLRPAAMLIVGIVTCVAIVSVAVTEWASSSILELYFLSVGQGDCAVCIAPGGRTVVVDAGPRFEGSDYVYDAGESVLLPFLRWRGVHHIDVLILTHFHSDHSGGLPALVQRGMVSVVCSTSSDKLRDVLGEAGHRMPLLIELAEGDAMRVGDDLAIRVIWPPETSARDPAADENEKSVVVELTYKRFDALITGDIGAAEELRIVTSRRVAGRSAAEATNRDTLGSDSEAAVSNQLEVLKVPHHGAQSSSSSVFLRSASPWLSVISVGPNRYGHPSEAALTRLARYSQVVVRTDQDRSIRIRTDGRRFSAVTSTGRVLMDDVRLQ